MKGAVYIGTSGWSYKHWRKRFYPEKLKPTDYLDYYAQFFNTTEINTSFYHLPKTKTVVHWAETVNRDFRFCPKISRYITHIKKLHDPEETLPKFFERFDPAKKMLGPVLIQLPPALAFDKERASAFYDVLKQYKGYAFALEARHESWFDEQSIELLDNNDITLVMAESGGRWPYREVLTASPVYVRLHGPEGYDSSYPVAFLEQLAEKLKGWEQEKHTIWIYFNNDGHGYALDNARKLMTMT